MKPPKITVAIPIRGEEPWALRTVKNAIETAGAEIDVVVVYDGRDPHPGMDLLCREIIQTREPIGTQKARHLGIMAAKTALIMSCDAHMTFSRDWARHAAEWFMQPGRRKTVACGMMGTLDMDGQPEGPAGYTGAQFHLRDRNPGNCEHSAYCLKWGDHKPGDQIGGIMGAFYFIRRKWYEEIGAPWECGTAWGCDEETLSASSWICGGEVRLLPREIYAHHLMQSMQKQGGYEPSLHHWIGVWLNRARLINVMPIPQEQKDELLDWICCSKYPTITPNFRLMVAADQKRDEVVRWRTRLAEGDYARLAPWISTDPTEDVLKTPSPVFPSDSWEKPATPAPTPFVIPPPPVIHRTREVCHLCDALDSYAVYSTREKGNVQYLKCRKCGAHAVRMNHGPLKPDRLN